MKKKLRSILCLLLALAMALSLAACGSKESKTDQPGETAAPETPEFVYTAGYTPLKAGDSNSLSPQVYTDDGFYAASYEKVGERELHEGETLQYEGQLDLYGSRLYFVSNKGEVKLLEGYEPLPSPEDTEGRTAYNSGSGVDTLRLNAEGKLIAVENRWENWFDGSPEEMEQEDSYDKYRYNSEEWIRVLAADGSEESSALVDYQSDPNEDVLRFYGCVLDQEGNLLGTTGAQLVAVKPDGSVAYTIEVPNYVETLVTLPDGRVAATSYGDSGMELVLVDAKSHSLGESFPLPNEAYNLIEGSGEYDLYYRSGMNLYGFSLDSGESEKLLNFISCDLNGDYVNGLHVNSDGSITGVYNDWSTEEAKSELVTLSKVPYDSVPHKESITMAVLWNDYELSNRIISFNRSSSDVRIELVDYSEFNTEDDYSAGQTKLLTEVMSGKMPDLFVLQGLPYRQLAAKGLLEDLYPYLDADSELKREDFFPTVLSAMEDHGKLCRICPSFSIQTLMAAASVVGEEPGWNVKEFKEALASMPAGCSPLGDGFTRGDILQRLVYMDMDDFVDWNTGKCDFESQEFIDLLEFANMFDAEFNWDPDFDWSTWESPEQRIAAGKQMCLATSIYSVDSVMYNDFYFGGDATYIGWPTNNGVGNMISFEDASYAMSVNCGNKDAAWKFLRSLLTEDYQKQIWSLPVSKAAFQEKLEAAMTPEYMKDADGNILLDENGEKRMYSKGGVGMSDGSVHEIYAMTQEQGDKLVALIDGTSRCVDVNESIGQIVMEQAEAYFQGQKSAQEVARLIQSKANIYVNEQR